ncbi:EmrB/QacA subfamily drug resistance transporter [Paenibacillus wynnii]|nr:EmrB/QacA subfamily drug resistance transporter [Paenibacillus wynnii]
MGESETGSIKMSYAPLLVIIAGMMMVILDSTIVNVAVPRLVELFGTNLRIFQWTITGYLLALSAVIPLAGWMTDTYGAKRIFLSTIGMFTLGSALCSMAQTTEQLILFRVIQGLGGGMVTPIGIAMVFKLAPPERRGSVMGMLGIPMLLAPALGPIMSGWLVQNVSWHWIFLINVPIGVITILFGIKYFPHSTRQQSSQLDILGMILAPVSFVLLVYGVNEGGVNGSSTAVTVIVIGLTTLLLFIIVELRHKNPLLELSVFKSSDFTRSIILLWIIQVILFSSMLLIPMYLQNIVELTPYETGVILLSHALASGITVPLGGRLFDKFGARPLVLIGLCIIFGSLFFLSSITTETSLGLMIACLILLGLGTGLSMMPLNTHILNSVQQRLVSRVTPLTTSSQQIVISFAVVALTGYLTSRVESHGATLDRMHAGVRGFGDTFFLLTCMAFLCLMLSLTLRKPRPLKNEEKV